MISKKGRQYKHDVSGCCVADDADEAARRHSLYDKRIILDIELYPPDARKRDLDNTVKAVQDALVFAGVFADDSQIDRLTVTRMEKVKGGKAIITISEAFSATVWQ